MIRYKFTKIDKAMAALLVKDLNTTDMRVIEIAEKHVVNINALRKWAKSNREIEPLLKRGARLTVKSKFKLLLEGIPDTPEFRRMWLDPDVTVPDLEKTFGYKRYNIAKAANAYGYGTYVGPKPPRRQKPPRDRRKVGPPKIKAMVARPEFSPAVVELMRGGDLRKPMLLEQMQDIAHQLDVSPKAVARAHRVVNSL